MKQRLQLIWTALTAPISVIEAREAVVKSAWQQVYIESVEDRLNKVTSVKWDLLGVSIAHSTKDLDTWEIQRFLGNAPYIIRNLLNMAKGKRP